MTTEPEGLAISPSERSALQARLMNVRREIALAARSAGRDPAEITLIGVSKFQPAALALAAVDLGLADLGENRVQEMTGKMDILAAAGRRPTWHMIGTLQRNKVKMVVGRADLIHSVDSLELLQDIGRISQARGLVSDILLEVNAGGEESKHGFEPDEVASAAAQAFGLAGIRLCGLMAMAPLFPDPDQTLPVFGGMRQLFQDVARRTGEPSFRILSMGMSHDFHQAITSGATHVRIGTAIFGPRL